MSLQESRRSLSAIELEGTARYRSISVWAVLALLTGLLSFIALAHPAAWILPAMAVTFGCWGLLRIGQQPDHLMGMPLALAGLLLGLCLLSWAPTRYFGDRWLVSRQAREFGEEWLTSVLAGQNSKAYQATLVIRRRQPRSTDLEAYYANDPLKRAERDAYFNDGLAKQLAELQGEGRWEFDECLGLTFDRTYTLISPRFFVYRSGEDQPVLHLQLEVTREADDDGVYWTMFRLSDADQVDRNLEVYRRQR